MSGRRTLKNPSRVSSRARLAGVVVLLVAGFLLHGLHRVNQQRALDPMDTSAYLQEAHFIAENGGPSRMLGLLVSGTYAFDNRQPLYPWILSWFAVRDFAFLPGAKLVSLAAGLVCFLLTLWVVRRLADNLTALLVGVFLIFDFTFFRLTSMVACESLLMVFVVGWWYAASAAFKRPRLWLLAGLLAGGAFMVKGSGLFLVGITALALLIRHRRVLSRGWFWMLLLGTAAVVWPLLRLLAGAATVVDGGLAAAGVGLLVALNWRRSVFRRQWVWLFFVGFVVTSWPLLARNVRRHGNPIHNFNATTMWLDHWKDIYRPEFKEAPPGPLIYLRTHSASQIASRAGEGLTGQTQMLFESLHGLDLPAMPNPKNRFRMVGAPFWIGGGLVLALAVVGFIRERRGEAGLLTVVSVGTFFLIFAWYHPVVQGARFILPMAPLIFFFAARGLIWLWVWLWGLQPLRVSALVLLGLTILYLAVLPMRNPLTSYDVPHGYEELRDWIVSNVGKDEPFVLGPTHIYRFEAYTPDLPGNRRVLPAVDSMDDLRRRLRKEGVRTVVIDIASCRDNQKLLADFIRLGPEADLLVVGAVPGWRLVKRAGKRPITYLVFRIDE